jgi:hypothetical protein
MNNQQGNEGIIQFGGTINADQLAVGKFATVSGTVNKTINELKASDVPEASQLADLLKQLQTAIESDSNLKPEEKSEALEQVQEIAKAAGNSRDAAMKKVAKMASRTLKGMLTELPNATQFVEACSKLLPLIAKVFVF